MNKGKLYLIPTYLSSSNDRNFIAPTVINVIENTQFFLVENVRTARRFISSLKLGIAIDELSFLVLNKKSNISEVSELMSPIFKGFDMGIISEAGLPGIADPGSLAVHYAHQNQVKIVTLPGASSMLLALISSGMNGQAFTFHGYVPIEKNERKKSIRKLEKEAESGYTQLIMETPYRNENLFSDLIETLQMDTQLTIALDLTGASEFISTQSVQDWRKAKRPALNKIPCVFVIGKGI